MAQDTLEDDSEGRNEGDHWLEDLSRYRGQMLPPGAWPPALRQFATRWQAYKDANGLLDFCDTIERCLFDVRIAPKRPSVIFADEAQDLNRMQLRRRRSDHLLLHRRVSGSHSEPGDPGRPQNHSEAELPRSARRPRRCERTHPPGEQATGKGVPAARRRRPVLDGFGHLGDA
ncbi:MAG: hypothetical protein IT161_18365 [Bryobacterales bacterium]|nr:hypothetical protein [Bryobacterales bacterium]